MQSSPSSAASDPSRPAAAPSAASPAPLGPGAGLLTRIGRALVGWPRALRLAVCGGWMGLIWTLSDSEMPDGPKSLGWRFLGNLFHAPLFGLLGLWCIAAVSERPEEGERMPRPGLRRLGLALACVLAYAAIDEVHQSFTPGRSPSPGDVGTDVVGASCVAWVVHYLGAPGASEAGLWARLLGGVLACCGAAGVATLF